MAVRRDGRGPVRNLLLSCRLFRAGVAPHKRRSECCLLIRPSHAASPPTPQLPPSAGLNSGSANDNKRTQHCGVIHGCGTCVCVGAGVYLFWDYNIISGTLNSAGDLCVSYTRAPPQAAVASHLGGQGGERRKWCHRFLCLLQNTVLKIVFCAWRVFL